LAEFEPWTKERGGAVIASEATCEGATLPILHALMKTFGYIHPETVPLIAETLNLTRGEVHGVVGFYHDFRRHPPERHVLRLCGAEACQSLGGDAVASHVRARLGVDWHETTDDGARDDAAREDHRSRCAGRGLQNVLSSGDSGQRRHQRLFGLGDELPRIPGDRGVGDAIEWPERVAGRLPRTGAEEPPHRGRAREVMRLQERR
jgi:formate dehydrogenase subunit gamma